MLACNGRCRRTQCRGPGGDSVAFRRTYAGQTATLGRTAASRHKPALRQPRHLYQRRRCIGRCGISPADVRRHVFRALGFGIFQYFQRRELHGKQPALQRHRAQHRHTDTSELRLPLQYHRRHIAVAVHRPLVQLQYKRPAIRPA